ncbi:MAG TPA: 16S rRNA (cytosine(967)-C(5))-methyltransferase [Lachnospiraceae bacterium]|nr:16S rRNA (cytosine(967)-C(5))-methyltransferase [Lachnospiraceae bacterium]
MENIRRIALETLMLAEREQAKSDKVLKDVLEKYSYLDNRELSYLNRLVNGVIERKLELDYITGCFSSVKPQRMKPAVRMILRMGTYELLYMDSVPDHAAVSEAVRLVKGTGLKNLAGFVNGVLRSIARNRDGIVYPDRERDTAGYLSTVCSVPLHIVNLLLKELGEDTAERVLREQLLPRPVFIRVNESRVTGEELGEELLRAGIETTPAPYVSCALTVTSPEGLFESRPFKEGLFGVSDISSMLAVCLSGVKKGDRVLDVCAAPGGKTCHVLDILDGSGEVVARDISPEKVSLIDENIKRQGFKGNVETQVLNALSVREGDMGRFDVLLADLPCSGLGVMGRKKDIKYRLSEDDLKLLSELQRDILRAVSGYVRPGGILMYTTCTIDSLENEANYEFIKNELPFEPVALSPLLPKELMNGTAESGYLQLLPGIHRSDGFFIAKFRRKDEGACYGK